MSSTEREEPKGLGFGGAVCLVTGAASGIGRAVARRLHAEGAMVAMADRNVAALEAGKETFDGDGQEHLLRLGLDVTRERDWDQALEKISETFGPVDVLVQAAGICSPQPLLQEDLAHWRATQAVNVEGPLLGIRAVGRQMAERETGVIVNVGSASGVRGVPGAAAYSVSKTSLRMLTRVAALELAEKGVRVNSVSPGGVATPMWTSQPWWPAHVRQSGSEEAAWQALAAETPVGRFAEADEVSEAICWLASPRCSYAVGEDLVIDGGHSIS